MAPQGTGVAPAPVPLLTQQLQEAAADSTQGRYHHSGRQEGADVQDNFVWEVFYRRHDFALEATSNSTGAVAESLLLRAISSVHDFMILALYFLYGAHLENVI